jgi:hypothetical protein
MSKKPAAPPPVAGPSANEDRLRLDTSIKEVGEANVSLKELLVASELRADAAEAARARAVADGAAYAAFAAREIATRDAELRALRASSVAAAAAARAAFTEAQDAATSERVSAAAAAATREAELLRSVQEATLRAESFMTFAEVKAADDERIAALEATVANERKESSEAYATLERQFIEAKLASARSIERMRSTLEHEATEKALAGLDGSQKRVIADNREMSKELTLTSLEARLAASRLAALATERTDIARRLADLESSDAEWTARCSRQAKLIKELEARVAELSGALAEETAARHAETTEQLGRFERESEAARTEIAGLGELVTLKNDELRTVKRLATIVLDARSETEQFLIDALEEVKLDVRRRRRDAAATAAAAGAAAAAAPPSPRSASAAAMGSSTSALREASSRFIFVDTSTASLRRRGAGAPAASPAATAAPPAAAASAVPDDLRGVVLAELTADDRERVLRLLLERINGAPSRADALASTRSAAAAEADGGRVPFGVSGL